MPKGYHLEFLLHNAHVTSDPEVDSAEVKLCKSQNRLKPLFAIGQVIGGIITLLRARGDQIRQFGRAAPFLTVIPYILMSIINLVCNLVAPDYSTLYMVRSQEMDEAIARGAKIDGTVGRLVQRVPLQANLPTRQNIEPSHGRRWPEEHTIGRSSSHRQVQIISQDKTFRTSNLVRRSDLMETANVSTLFLLIVQFVLGLIPFAIVGFWTRSRHGKISTAAQFLLTFFWLTVTVIFGPYAEWTFQAGMFKRLPRWFWIIYLVGIYSLACSIGGLVVVGQMLQIWGNCTRINGIGS